MVLDVSLDEQSTQPRLSSFETFDQFYVFVEGQQLHECKPTLSEPNVSKLRRAVYHTITSSTMQDVHLTYIGLVAPIRSQTQKKV